MFFCYNFKSLLKEMKVISMNNIKQAFNQANSAQQYNLIKDKFTGFEGYSMPMSFRKLIQVQLSANTVTLQPPLGDNRSRHIKAFMAGTVGAAFTAVARIIRIAVFTVFLLPAVLVRFATATRYGFEGAVPELLRKYCEEWVDLAVTAGSIPLGLAKTIKPTAFFKQTNQLTEYYLQRTDRRIAFNERELTAQTAYRNQVAQAAAIRTQRLASA